MHRSLVTFAVLAVLSLPSLAAAAANEYHVDPVHSEIGFKVRHLVSKTPGRFDTYEGKVRMDPADIARTLKLSAVIEAASVNTRNEKRDEHLRSADFLDVASHETITFESKSVKAKGKDKFSVTGDLTIRGVTKPVTLSVQVTGTATLMGSPMVGMDITGKINRKDYGVVWNKALDTGGFVLGDDVELEIHVEAAVPKPES